MLDNAVADRFREIATGSPEACALIADQQRLSYAALLGRVDHCARALGSAGVRPGHAVALAFGNGVDFVVGAFASFALGAILVPLNPLFKKEELEHCLALAKPSALLHLQALVATVEQLEQRIPIHSTSTELISGCAVELPEPEADATTGVYMFSSGSTGKSKRVTRSQRQLWLEASALRQAAEIGAQERIVCCIPLFHAHGFCNAMLAALLSGSTLIIPQGDWSPRAVLRALQAEQVTVFPGVPFMFELLTKIELAAAVSLSQLRLAISAGAPLPAEVSGAFERRFGQPVHQLYGSTETGAISLNLTRARDKPSSVGRALPGTQIVIKGERAEPLGVGEPGEIWVAAESATRGYDGLPALSAQHFRGGHFATGDLGYLDTEGDLFITGRKKLLINVAGYKVDPLEVEQLLQRHPSVKEAVVVGVPAAGAGEKVKAVVVLVEGRGASERELISFAASELADYKVPKEIEFRSEIPRSPLGKVLRKYL